jgi:hypothetical protein
MDVLTSVGGGDWRQAPLSELGEIQPGASTVRAQPTEAVSEPVPVVNPAEIRAGRIATVAAKAVTRHQARTMGRFRVMPGDVVCVRTGDLGRAGLAGKEHQDWIVGTSCMRIRLHDVSRMNPAYLVCYLNHSGIHARLMRSTGTLPTLSAASLSQLSVSVPPLHIQDEILRVLRALEQKISAHEEAVRNTREMRDTLLPSLISGAINLDL